MPPKNRPSNSNELANVLVLCRIVACDNKELVDKIVRFNNTQNIMRAFDLRSNDTVQKKLSDEFSHSGITYVHRRSGRIPSNAISAETVGPALAAFHGDFQTAGRNRRDIFERDAVYERVFPRSCDAQHVLMVHSLSAALDNTKSVLKAKDASEIATDLEGKQYNVMKYSMSKYFLLYLIGSVGEEIMDRKIADRFRWKCKQLILAGGGSELVDAWSGAIAAIMPFVATAVEKLGEPYDVVRSQEMGRSVVKEVQASLAALKAQLAVSFDGVRKATTV